MSLLIALLRNHYITKPSFFLRIICIPSEYTEKKEWGFFIGYSNLYRSGT